MPPTSSTALPPLQPPHTHTVTCPTAKSIIKINDEIGESSFLSNYTCSSLRFHMACIRIHEHPDIALLDDTSHTVTSFLQNFCANRTLVTTGISMPRPKRIAVLRYTFRGFIKHGFIFLVRDLVEKTSMGHIVFLTWSAIQDLPGIWLILVGLILYEGRHP